MSAKAAPPFASNPFALGVASGDPTPDGVVLWTRLAPDPLNGGGMSGRRVRRALRGRRRRGLPAHRAARRGRRAAGRGAHRARRARAASSRRRRTGTGSSGAGPTSRGRSHAHRAAAGLHRADAVRVRVVPELHERVLSAPTPTSPRRTSTSSCTSATTSTRARGSAPTRVRDHVPQARAVHAQRLPDAPRPVPDRPGPAGRARGVPVPDDVGRPRVQGQLRRPRPRRPTEPLETVAARRAAAYLAYWEHAPLPRARKPVGKDMPLFRRLHWGALATFHVLDTRQYRSDQIAAQCTPAAARPAFGLLPRGAARPTRGDPRRRAARLAVRGPRRAGRGLERDREPGRLRAARPQLGARTRSGFNLDNWDGYVADRQRVLDFLAEPSSANTVVITGDSHENSVRNVPPDFRSFDGTPVATEFLGTSISSEGDTPYADDGSAASPQQPAPAVRRPPSRLRRASRSTRGSGRPSSASSRR